MTLMFSIYGESHSNEECSICINTLLIIHSNMILHFVTNLRTLRTHTNEEFRDQVSFINFFSDTSTSYSVPEMYVKFLFFHEKS